MNSIDRYTAGPAKRRFTPFHPSLFTSKTPTHALPPAPRALPPRGRGLPPRLCVGVEFAQRPQRPGSRHGAQSHGADAALAGATGSFLAFALGAFVPLIPWLGGSGTGAVWASALLGVGATATVGGLVARLTERSVVRTAIRQMLVAGGACMATYWIGGILGASVG